MLTFIYVLVSVIEINLKSQISIFLLQILMRMAAARSKWEYLGEGFPHRGTGTETKNKVSFQECVDYCTAFRSDFPDFNSFFYQEDARRCNCCRGSRDLTEFMEHRGYYYYQTEGLPKLSVEGEVTVRWFSIFPRIPPFYLAICVGPSF